MPKRPFGDLSQQRNLIGRRYGSAGTFTRRQRAIDYVTSSCARPTFPGVLIPIKGISLQLRFFASNNCADQRDKLLSDRRSLSGGLAVAEEFDGFADSLPSLRSAIYDPPCALPKKLFSVIFP
jgi:hypothetical protein